MKVAAMENCGPFRVNSNEIHKSRAYWLKKKPGSHDQGPYNTSENRYNKIPSPRRPVAIYKSVWSNIDTWETKTPIKRRVYGSKVEIKCWTYLPCNISKSFHGSILWLLSQSCNVYLELIYSAAGKIIILVSWLEKDIIWKPSGRPRNYWKLSCPAKIVNQKQECLLGRKAGGFHIIM